eukprot:TRINITY_DN16370_c0_g1_i1.p1 TRINITY_DN16370_c0_g1~~TRINITY_DN16370_c0_g1_i1.p1  ORF type:complete len:528 (+),score=133.25 TRINITY_DN16370_c0_g1_i1:31-1614(+)
MLYWLLYAVLGFLLLGQLLIWWQKLPEKRIKLSSPFKVVIAGAGFGGLCIGKKLSELGIPYSIYEAADDLGGVWHLNTYPAVACDVSAFLYSYSFEPFYPWSEPFAPGQQIHNYLKHVAHKYNIQQNISLKTKVLSAQYDQNTGLWSIELLKRGGDGEVREIVTANVFISAVGQLNEPHIPNFKGKDTFKGFSFHTSQWCHDIPLENKRIAVVGTGPTAVQIIPEVVKIAKQVAVFSRTPAHVAPRGNYKISKVMTTLYQYIPILIAIPRWSNYLIQDLIYGPIILKTGPNWMSKTFSKFLEQHMMKRLHLKENQEKLIPRDYEIGCKRILLSDNYLVALEKDNVKMVYEAIEEITEEGIRTKDQHIKVDGIIWATGFKTNEFLRTLEVYSPKKPEGLHQYWKKIPQAYYGITVPFFPNFFILYGPNTNLSHNSIIFMLEVQTNYIVDGIKKMVLGKIKSVEIKEEVFEEYVRGLRKGLKETAFSSNCRSWYKNEEGEIINNSHLLTLTYWWRLLTFNLSNYHFVEN